MAQSWTFDTVEPAPSPRTREPFDAATLHLAAEWTVLRDEMRDLRSRLGFNDRVRLSPPGVTVPHIVDPPGPTSNPPGQPRWPYGTLLSRLDPDARQALLGLGVRRRVPAGEILIHEGMPGGHLVLIRQGLTKVTARMPDGRTALLAIRVGGDLIGEMSALNRAPRSATVTTCRAADIRKIQPDDFTRFLKEFPDAALEIIAMLADRLRWSNNRRIDFTSYSVGVRIARVIADLARTHGRRTRDGLVIDVHLTQPDLATICGAAETTTQKALRDLRTDGLVDTDYRRITVRDLDRLRRVAKLDPQG
nr:Crp/Fnr family transcriptional regulator [Micromonospora sp. DSM 115978]